MNPTIINNDVSLLMYIIDVDADGFRPILRINIVERSFEGLLNSSPPPPRHPKVDDDLNNYENDGDHPINIEDDSMHMEDVSSHSEDAMDGSFIYYFSAFGACIRGYAHKRKVIAIDRIHLYGKHISIVNAFSHVYSHAHHGLCMRRFTKNLCVNQHCGEHLYLFYVVEKAYSLDDEFSEHFKELKNIYPEVAHVLENVFSFEKWSKAHFLGNRYDVMTTNITESLNSMLIDEQEYPVSYIFNSISRKFGQKFRERHTFVDGTNNKFVPCAEKILRDNKSESDSLNVNNANGGLDQFTMFGNGVTTKINLLERSYSCRKFDLVKILYEHAISSLRAKYGDGEGYGNSMYE
ncbi:hypothetical protein BC332_15373 [Capsicum chinense]|nr:hypothetical protein BC332_15373 [Capsicum chinense]